MEEPDTAWVQWEHASSRDGRTSSRQRCLSSRVRPIPFSRGIRLRRCPERSQFGGDGRVRLRPRSTRYSPRPRDSAKWRRSDRCCRPHRLLGTTFPSLARPRRIGFGRWRSSRFSVRPQAFIRIPPRIRWLSAAMPARSSPLQQAICWLAGPRSWPEIPWPKSVSSEPLATWAITDGNQRRDQLLGIIRDNLSYVLSPGQSVGNASPSAPLGFVVVPGEVHETVEAPIGAASIAASSYGSYSFISLPDEGPAAAFDGNPFTAWVANSQNNSVDQWISISFQHPMELSTITIRSAGGHHRTPGHKGGDHHDRSWIGATEPGAHEWSPTGDRARRTQQQVDHPYRQSQPPDQRLSVWEHRCGYHRHRHSGGYRSLAHADPQRRTLVIFRIFTTTSRSGVELGCEQSEH